MKSGPEPMGSSNAVCPSCGRFIGPSDDCPYCGTDSAKPSFLVKLRWGTVAFAVFGVVALVIGGARREVPRVRIGELVPTMRYARVEVQGIVERDAYVGEKDGQVDFLGFTLLDATQSVRVAAYGEVAVACVRMRQIPKAHECVKATGSVVVGRDGRTRLRLDSTEDLIVTPGDATRATGGP